MFRTKYLRHSELERQLGDWSRIHPDCVRVTSLGRSAEGRDVALLTLGPEPERLRPAVWVDANMHATEVCGSSVALAIAESVIGLHQGRSTGLPAHLEEILREVLFYVVPRMSPDGAEHVLSTGRYVRSSPVDARRQRGEAYWEADDFDGDGRLGFMRQRCEAGELVALPGHPEVLVPRLPEDPPPYWRLYPEGRIVHFDGRRIPSPGYLSDNSYDFNRNFPYGWAPEHEQIGAGDYPGSAPETRAVLDFTVAHPEIFAWLNLHTFGGVAIRPLGDKPDHEMNQGDLAVFQQVAAWMTEHAGYPTVSGFHDFLYEPGKPLRGDLTEYAYHQRGCLAYVVELWDLFHRLGMPRRKPFVDAYTQLSREDYAALARFDRDLNQGRIFRSWRPVTHPQLGEVEVGGLDLLVGVSNPPYELLPEICAQQTAAFLRVAALVPRIAVEVVAREVLRPDLTRLELRIVNRGYLSSAGLESARKLPHVEPLRLTTRGDGLTLRAPAESVVELGHLEGWGQGLHNGSALFAPWTRGNGHERFVTLVVEGAGRLLIRVGSPRVGFQELAVDLCPPEDR
jgi:hypothetical protein